MEPGGGAGGVRARAAGGGGDPLDPAGGRWPGPPGEAGARGQNQEQPGGRHAGGLLPTDIINFACMTWNFVRISASLSALCTNFVRFVIGTAFLAKFYPILM